MFGCCVIRFVSLISPYRILLLFILTVGHNLHGIVILKICLVLRTQPVWFELFAWTRFNSKSWNIDKCISCIGLARCICLPASKMNFDSLPSCIDIENPDSMMVVCSFQFALYTNAIWRIIILAIDTKRIAFIVVRILWTWINDLCRSQSHTRARHNLATAIHTCVIYRKCEWQ